MSGRCEWPARVGATEKCGKPAKAFVTADGTWGRHVCGIHLNQAQRIGWAETAPKEPGR